MVVRNTCKKLLFSLFNYVSSNFPASSFIPEFSSGLSPEPCPNNESHPKQVPAQWLSISRYPPTFDSNRPHGLLSRRPVRAGGHRRQGTEGDQGDRGGIPRVQGHPECHRHPDVLRPSPEAPRPRCVGPITLKESLLFLLRWFEFIFQMESLKTLRFFNNFF